MNSTIYICLILVLATCVSCNNSSNENDEKSLSISSPSVDSCNNKENDTILDTLPTQKVIEENSDSLINHNNIAKKEIERNVSDWSIDDFIITCSEYYKDELRLTIKYEKEDWDGVKNPFVATYEGNDFGDYHHIEFEDANEKRYDFGFGNNDYGDILLFYDDDQLSDNPKYLGKSFMVYWDWKASSFPCCSGDYELVEAYSPSITKLELIEN